MDLSTLISLFNIVDLISLAILFACWFIIGLLIENPNAARPSVSTLMARYRREWMVEFLTREPRIFDASILATLREGTTFFASACMIAIGGGLALVGNTESLAGLANEFSHEMTPRLVWTIKLIVALIFLSNGFLKFVWSHRLFGYCAVVMASVPNDPTDPVARKRAQQAAEINITAARSFNRGLRAVYFALAALAWLFGAYALIGAVIMTFFVLWRREFASVSRQTLLSEHG